MPRAVNPFTSDHEWVAHRTELHGLAGIFLFLSTGSGMLRSGVAVIDTFIDFSFFAGRRRLVTVQSNMCVNSVKLYCQILI